jgi:hypothetical protein
VNKIRSEYLSYFRSSRNLDNLHLNSCKKFINRTLVLCKAHHLEKILEKRDCLQEWQNLWINYLEEVVEPVHSNPLHPTLTHNPNLTILLKNLTRSEIKKVKIAFNYLIYNYFKNLISNFNIINMLDFHHFLIKVFFIHLYWLEVVLWVRIFLVFKFGISLWYSWLL